eukprot:jgi/Undpi1/362/HiC_scaffold_1.g00358.m1
MVKTTPTVFGVLSALALSNAAEYTARVRNLTYMQPFSPPLVVAHTQAMQDVALFREGMAASDAIKLMAEDGDNSALLTALASADYSPYICGYTVSDAPLFPGETWRGTMEVDESICGEDAVFSVVSMLINTNDAFVGVDSERLSGGSKSFPPAFDAGTESNNELCSHIPGPACDMDSGNEQDAPGEEFIHVHRGIHGEEDLSTRVYDWRNPVAEVFIFAPQE